MLGVIALTQGYSLIDYAQIMRVRKQTESRVKNVSTSLEYLSKVIQPNNLRSAEPIELVGGSMLDSDSVVELEDGVRLRPDGSVVLPDGQVVKLPSGNGNTIVINVISQNTTIQDSVLNKVKINGKK